MDGRIWMAVSGHPYNERKMDGRIWSSISFFPLSLERLQRVVTSSAIAIAVVITAS